MFNYSQHISTCTRHSCVHINVQNMLLMLHSLMDSSPVSGYCSYAGVPCDNIGLVLVCLPSGSTDVAASPSQQPSRIPILSPVLFMHVGDPYIPPF